MSAPHDTPDARRRSFCNERRARRHRLTQLALLLCASCHEEPERAQLVPGQPRPSARTLPQIPVASASTPSPGEGSPPAGPLEQFQKNFAWSIDANCADPRLVLAADYPSAKANQAWLEELLVVAPELAARFRPNTPTYLYRALYGGKRFRPAEPGEIADPFKQAVIARCGDVAACRMLAGAYGWLRPTHSSQQFCGLPPATTSPEQVLDTSTRPLKRDWSATRVCARYRACTLRTLQTATPPATALSCDGLPPTARKCAELEDCEKVRSCIDALERQANRPFREAEPRRVAGHAPNVGF